MWSRFGILVLAALAGAHPVAGQAMSTHEERNCRVTGAEKLPAASGGAGALCAAIEAAVDQHAPKVRYDVEVKVLSRSRLAATILVDDRRLPEQKFAVTDRDLNSESIKRFAAALALEVTRASRGDRPAGG
jgi:hypothetical protein